MMGRSTMRIFHRGVTSVLSVGIALGSGTASWAAGTSPAPYVSHTRITDQVNVTGPVVVYPALLNGTLSGSGDLYEDNAVIDNGHSHFRLPTALDGWFQWKKSIAERYGLRFGGSWGVLWQNYSDSLVGEHNAVGQKFTANISYDLLNRGAPDALAFDMVIEDRGPIGTKLPPLFGGFGAGSLVPTAATWGDFDLGITQAYIRQSLWNNKFQYTIGKIFAPNYINAYPFFDDNRQFFNQTFSTDPTIASPLRGFGMVGALYPTNTGLYVQSGMFTVHSDDTGSTIKDFFDKSEHFYSVAVGWSGLSATNSAAPIQARGSMDSDNINLTAWYRNRVQETSEPESYGVAFNFNRMIQKDVMVFVRGGWSEGWRVRSSLSTGLGWRPTEHHNDLFGFGFGWAKPALDSLRDQWSIESFYRYQLTDNFAITPDIQLVINPALNPRKDTLWVFGTRARVSF